MDKTKQFAGSWAVILGGSGGFGFGALQKLAAHGMNVAVLYRETSITEKPLKIKLSQIADANGITILPFNNKCA